MSMASVPGGRPSRRGIVQLCLVYRWVARRTGNGEQGTENSGCESRLLADGFRLMPRARELMLLAQRALSFRARGPASALRAGIAGFPVEGSPLGRDDCDSSPSALRASARNDREAPFPVARSRRSAYGRPARHASRRVDAPDDDRDNSPGAHTCRIPHTRSLTNYSIASPPGTFAASMASPATA